MQIQNHKEEVPFEHYAEKFRALDPQEASRRTGAAFDPERGTFSVALLGVEYHIAWPEYAISADEPSAMALKSLPCQTFLLRFLLEGRRAEPYSAFKTFRELPWGEVSIQPYTGRCLTRAAFTFGTRLPKFKAACEKMQALPLSHGDAGYQFDLIGGYRMQILVWEGDDEFPPNAQVLYSDNFAEGFAAEDRVVAGDILISTIKSQM